MNLPFYKYLFKQFFMRSFQSSINHLSLFKVQLTYLTSHWIIVNITTYPFQSKLNLLLNPLQLFQSHFPLPSFHLIPLLQSVQSFLLQNFKSFVLFRFPLAILIHHTLNESHIILSTHHLIVYLVPHNLHNVVTCNLKITAYLTYLLQIYPKTS